MGPIGRAPWPRTGAHAAARAAPWRAASNNGPSHLASAELSAFLREASLAEVGAVTHTVVCAPEEGPLGVTMGSEPTAGARVCAIGRGSRAERAGLRVGDRIMRVNGTAAKGALEAKQIIEESSRRRAEIVLAVLRARPVKHVPATCVLERRLHRAADGPRRGVHPGYGHDPRG